MNNLAPIEYTRPTQSEQSKLDLGLVFFERRMRERNAWDDRIEKARKDRELRSMFWNLE